MTMNAEQKHREALAQCEQARAVAREMIANGQQRLTPDVCKALRELDAGIEESRKMLGVNRRG